MSKIKSVLSVLLTLLLCLSLTACILDIPTSTQTPGEQDSDPSTTSAADTTDAVTTAPAADVPGQELCWWCSEAPVAGDSVYCFNCKCMLCDRARKGDGYLYCSEHNCNDSYCTGQALDNSQYCVAHKCAEPNCRSERQQNSEYCYVHDQ